MGETTVSVDSEKMNKEATQLAAVLIEMKEGLDKVKAKVQDLTAKVKANQFPTADGISYLEAKNLLLLSYCQSLVYYLLQKAQGFSINGHPVVRSLVEIRLFLEKIRPIDKKLQYQIQKLTRPTSAAVETTGLTAKESDAPQKTDEALKLRPNPDMLQPDETAEDGTGVYKPPKFAPALMEEDRIAKQERNALRKEKEALRQAQQSAYVRDLMNDLEGRPEEIQEAVGAESRELQSYRAKMEKRARREEELFTRAPLTKMEKKKEKHLLKSRSGLAGLADSFYDEIKSLPMEEDGSKEMPESHISSKGTKRFKKRKRKH